MFEKFKDMGNLVKKAKEMKKKMEEVQGELKDIRIVGEDKKGSIKVALTGELDCVGVKISDPNLLKPENKENLEKSIAQAFNQAAKKAKTTASSKLSEVSQGLKIPGLTG